MCQYRERLKEVVKISYGILTEKINGQSICIDNEAGFKLQFAYVLKCIGELFQYSIDDIFSIELEKGIKLDSQSNKSMTDKAKIDIYLTLGNKTNQCTCAIELKYFKKENHREPNNRYDVFNDINNLEMYRDNGVDLCYFVVGTDHLHYVNQESYSTSTKDFDFRDGKSYTKNKNLSYRTSKPYGKDISLNNDYYFKWDYFKEKYFLKVDIE